MNNTKGQLNLYIRRIAEFPENSGIWTSFEEQAIINPHKTAVVICDMWDRHWCRGATARTGEMAPHVNSIANKLRKSGALIIHGASDTMDFYRDYQGRKLAREAFSGYQADASRTSLASGRIVPKKPLPVDDSDGGCECIPKCSQSRAWTRQINIIEIADEDAITDSEEAICAHKAAWH